MSGLPTSPGVASGGAPEVRRRRTPWIVTAVCALLIAASAVAWLVIPAEGSSSAEGQDQSRSRGPSDTAAVGPGNGSGPIRWEPTTPDPDVPEPGEGVKGSTGVDAVSVSIPSIAVESVLVPLGLDPGTRVLVPPERYDVAGVLEEGTVPGDIGPAIIAGHVDSRAGPGVFYRLEEVALGDLISVGLTDGQRIDFRVVEVSQYPKTAFPTDAVYGPTPERELRVITCGGSFDSTRLSYVDNIVVYAVRV